MVILYKDSSGENRNQTQSKRKFQNQTDVVTNEQECAILHRRKDRNQNLARFNPRTTGHTAQET